MLSSMSKTSVFPFVLVKQSVISAKNAMKLYNQQMAIMTCKSEFKILGSF